MVQSIDLSNPVYNAVNISIKKPEVITGTNTTNPITAGSDNGIYNAVKIDIDNPKVNPESSTIYDYPQAEGLVTYEMLNINPIELPVIGEEKSTEVATEDVSERNKEIEIPAPNYTTIEAEKDETAEKKTPDISTKLSFRGEEKVVKKPEIVPSESILPKVDISIVSQNLNSTNRDVQAQQIEEIVRTVMLDEDTAKNYLVSDVFANLIKIAQQDVTKLEAPTQKQVEIRQKLIANIMAVEKDQKAINNLPYKLSDEDMAYAMNLSELELAERNKEYAITAIGALAELFIEDFSAKEGRIVPITDVPGVAAIVDVLRRDPDPSVKLSALDALRHIKREEYKEELSALFTIVQTDPNPAVAKAASISLQELK